MRVIIIEDKDAKALLDQLKLANYEQHGDCYLKVQDGATQEQIVKAAYQHAHQWFHYHVVQWLQKQGANFL